MKGQKHGKQFEDMLKALLFSGASDIARKPTQVFDIEAKFDKILGLNTSIKASKNCKTVALADARRFWSIKKPYRLLVACWQQKSKTEKVFYKVHEFILHEAILSALHGTVNYEMVESFHNGLSLAEFPQGEHEQARKWAKNKKKEIEAHRTLLILNPKIDSKTQRRLQCSVKLTTLVELAESCSAYKGGAQNHIIYEDSIGDMVLPLSIKSEPRQFLKATNLIVP